MCVAAVLEGFSEGWGCPPQVFSREDLEHVAHLVEQHRAYAVLDEVYEHLVFDGAEHISMRGLPGMEERAIRIGSAGKSFSFTGWKVRCRPQAHQQSSNDVCFLMQIAGTRPSYNAM